MTIGDVCEWIEHRHGFSVSPDQVGRAIAAAILTHGMAATMEQVVEKLPWRGFS